MADWERDGLGARRTGDLDRPAPGPTGTDRLRRMQRPRPRRLLEPGIPLPPEAQGHGFATEVSREALLRAHDTAPERPVAAYLVEHNVASARVATNVGLELRHRAPDAGNPDPGVMRLVYSDRPLHDEQLTAVLQ